MAKNKDDLIERVADYIKDTRHTVYAEQQAQEIINLVLEEAVARVEESKGNDVIQDYRIRRIINLLKEMME